MFYYIIKRKKKLIKVCVNLFTLAQYVLNQTLLIFVIWREFGIEGFNPSSVCNVDWPY